MTLSSSLRSRRAPRKHEENIKSEVFSHLQTSHTKNNANTHEGYLRRSKPLEHPGCLLYRKDYTPSWNRSQINIVPSMTYVKKGGRRSPEGSRAFGEINEALGSILWTKKMKEQSHTRDAEPSIPKKTQ